MTSPNLPNLVLDFLEGNASNGTAGLANSSDVVDSLLNVSNSDGLADSSGGASGHERDYRWPRKVWAAFAFSQGAALVPVLCNLVLKQVPATAATAATAVTAVTAVTARPQVVPSFSRYEGQDTYSDIQRSNFDKLSIAYVLTSSVVPFGAFSFVSWGWASLQLFQPRHLQWHLPSTSHGHTTERQTRILHRRTPTTL